MPLAPLFAHTGAPGPAPEPNACIATPDPSSVDPFARLLTFLRRMPESMSTSRMGIELPMKRPALGGRFSVTARATAISEMPSAASMSRSAAHASRLAAASHASSVSLNLAHASAFDEPP